MEGGHFDPFGDNDDNDNDDNDNDDEKSFLKALQLRWGALKNRLYLEKMIQVTW